MKKLSVKHSIRTRITLIFIGVMATALVIIWVLNNWLLESFYQSQKVKELENAFELVNQVMQQEGIGAVSKEIQELDEQKKKGQDTKQGAGEATENLADGPMATLLRNLNEKSNISLVIMDSSSGTLLSTERRGDYLSQRFLSYVLDQEDHPSEIVCKNDHYTIQKSYNPMMHSLYLDSWGFFSDNSTSFIMSMPVASIQESAALSNRFLAYVGLLVLAAGSILIFFTTKMITSPILSLTDISERMSSLDFDAHYDGSSVDELGVLGNSMNVLSERLKQSIGELKTANLELQKDVEEKTQIDEMRKDFIANVSHELKTPIALIQGYAEGLTEGMAEEEESRNYYCEVIMDEANKMNTMVKQLLTLSALESGNDATVMDRFNLTELIRGVLNSARILIEQTGASIRFEQTEPVYVWADEFKIEEVITNYLNNALNHANGEKQIVITLETTDQEVTTRVFNTGDHIPETDLPNLWTKFYKVDKARTRAYGGSGIGLSIVKAIMDSHRKECGVENVDGGVIFWFTLDGEKS